MCGVAVRSLSAGTCPAAMPDSAANGPHGFFTIHTCSIGTLPASVVPGGQLPLLSLRPANTFCNGITRLGEADVVVHMELRERTLEQGRNIREPAPGRQHVHRCFQNRMTGNVRVVHERLGMHRVEDVAVVCVRPVHQVLVAGRAIADRSIARGVRGRLIRESGQIAQRVTHQRFRGGLLGRRDAGRTAQVDGSRRIERLDRRRRCMRLVRRRGRRRSRRTRKRGRCRLRRRPAERRSHPRRSSLRARDGSVTRDRCRRPGRRSRAHPPRDLLRRHGSRGWRRLGG